ncbi:MAG TPA: hypothetical protein VFJ58_22490, partial [Armatimonadota bacterium]|nr:hypothetical protein [Armatimonadota bacterium]
MRDGGMRCDPGAGACATIPLAAQAPRRRTRVQRAPGLTPRPLRLDDRLVGVGAFDARDIECPDRVVVLR